MLNSPVPTKSPNYQFTKPSANEEFAEFDVPLPICSVCKSAIYSKGLFCGFFELRRVAARPKVFTMSDDGEDSPAPSLGEALGLSEDAAMQLLHPTLRAEQDA